MRVTEAIGMQSECVTERDCRALPVSAIGPGRDCSS